MARQVDYYGTSFYPMHSAFVDRDVTWRAALLEFTRLFGYEKGRTGYWVGELQGGLWFGRPAGEFTAFDLASGRTEQMEQVPGGVQLGAELAPGAVQVVRITGR